MYKKAFTLAEVLITLGILAGIAAMTIPTLIQNYQKKVTVNRLKKTYSIISNAMDMAKAEYGDMSSWEVSKEGGNAQISEAYINKYFLPYLDGYRKVFWGTFSEYYNFSEYIGSGGYFVELKDGTTLTFAFGTKIDVEGNWSFDKFPYIVIDINGKLKPNVVGRDRFKFCIQKGKLIASVTYQNKSNSVVISACKANNPDACTELLFRNNWEFPADYPW